MQAVGFSIGGARESVEWDVESTWFDRGACDLDGRLEDRQRRRFSSERE